MAGDGISTRLQKEVSLVQQEISKFQELVHLDSKMNIKLQEFKEKFKGDLQSLLEHYFGPPNAATTVGVGKGKGVLRAPPGLAPKESIAPNSKISIEMGSAPMQVLGEEVSNRLFRLECLKFDGIEFRGW